jgi:hypothetical protein
MPGRLFSSAASLLVLFSEEALKWQFPAVAAGEKLASLAASLRRLLPQAVLPSIDR